MDRSGSSIPASVFLWLILVFYRFSRGSANAEGDALNALKTQLSDPNNVLQSWDPTLVNPCTWFHVTCNSDNSVTRVDLGNANLSGQLVPQLGQLLNLQYLELYSNNISGRIPLELGNLTNLVSLDLFLNNLSGRIPATLGNLQKLRFLRLNNNTLTGTIPMSLTTILTLQVLDLSNNHLTGAIPVNGSFSLFTPLSFANNQLETPPPAPPPPVPSNTPSPEPSPTPPLTELLTTRVSFRKISKQIVWRRKKCSNSVAKLCVLFPEREDTEANVKKIFELDPLVRSFKAFPVLFSPERVEEESPTNPSKMSTATTRSKALVSTADLLAGAKARRSLRKDSKLPPTPLSMASSSEANISKKQDESKKRKLVEAADTDASDILDGERTREKFVVVMKDFADKLSGIMTPIMDQAAILKIKVARSSVEAEEARKEMKASAGEISKLKKEVKMQSNEIVRLRKELADACAERLTENEAHVKELEAAREDFKFNATKALLETRIQMMEEMKSGLAVHWDLEEERKTLEDFVSEPVDAEEVNSPALEELIEDANKVLSSMVGTQIEGQNQEKETEVTPTAVGQNVDKV